MRHVEVRHVKNIFVPVKFTNFNMEMVQVPANQDWSLKHISAFMGDSPRSSYDRMVLRVDIADMIMA